MSQAQQVGYSISLAIVTGSGKDDESQPRDLAGTPGKETMSFHCRREAGKTLPRSSWPPFCIGAGETFWEGVNTLGGEAKRRGKPESP